MEIILYLIALSIVTSGLVIIGFLIKFWMSGEKILIDDKTGLLPKRRKKRQNTGFG